MTKDQEIEALKAELAREQRAHERTRAHLSRVHDLVQKGGWPYKSTDHYWDLHEQVEMVQEKLRAPGKAHAELAVAVIEQDRKIHRLKKARLAWRRERRDLALLIKHFESRCEALIRQRNEAKRKARALRATLDMMGGPR